MVGKERPKSSLSTSSTTKVAFKIKKLFTKTYNETRLYLMLIPPPKIGRSGKAGKPAA